MLRLLNKPTLSHSNAEDVHGIITWSSQEVVVKRTEFSSQAASFGYFALLLGHLWEASPAEVHPPSPNKGTSHKLSRIL